MSDSSAGNISTVSKALAASIAAVAAAGLVESVWVRWGYEPFLYCNGAYVLRVTSLGEWYRTLFFGVCIGGLVVGCAYGLRKALPWFGFLLLLGGLPGWLEEGLSYGRRCSLPPQVKIQPITP